MTKNSSKYVTGSVVLTESYDPTHPFLTLHRNDQMRYQSKARHARKSQYDWMVPSILTESSRGVSSYKCSKASLVVTGLVFFLTSVGFVFIGA